MSGVMMMSNYSKKQERERVLSGQYSSVPENGRYENNLGKSAQIDDTLNALEKSKVHWRKYLSLWRSKPDLFIDFISDERTPVKLYAYQRMFLRLIFRNKEVYFVATRGTAKSYIAILAMFLKCIMYPNSKIFISAPGKAQGATIAKEKIGEIMTWYPALKGELARRPIDNKDYFRLEFKNNSYLDIVPIANSARGGRRTAGLVEEIADESIDPDILNESVLPMMALNRQTVTGKIDRENEIHKQKIFITTAGRKQSYAFALAQTTIEEMLSGKKSFYFGAGYQLGTMYDTQLDLEDILDKRAKLTVGGFQREYESVWTGTSQDALVSSEDIFACRKLLDFEDSYTEEKKGVDFFYTIAYDVARSEGKETADSAMAVIKAIDRGDGTYKRKVVKLIGMDGSMHFKLQARELKMYVEMYKASALVVDANGLGAGIIDYLLDEIDEYPSYSVMNNSDYDKYRKADSAEILYVLKSTTKDNKASDIHNHFMISVKNRDVEFLIGEQDKKMTLLQSKKEKAVENYNFTSHIATDLFVDEVMNLKYHYTGSMNMTVKQISNRINKDKYSAVSYGMWYIKQKESDNLVNKGRSNANAKMMMKIRKAKGF